MVGTKKPTQVYSKLYLDLALCLVVRLKKYGEKDLLSFNCNFFKNQIKNIVMSFLKL